MMRMRCLINSWSSRGGGFIVRCLVNLDHLKADGVGEWCFPFLRSWGFSVVDKLSIQSVSSRLFALNRIDWPSVWSDWMDCNPFRPFDRLQSVWTVCNPFRPFALGLDRNSNIWRRLVVEVAETYGIQPLPSDGEVVHQSDGEVFQANNRYLDFSNSS